MTISTQLRSDWFIRLLLALILAGVEGSSGFAVRAEPGPNVVQVTFLNVGQGDVTLTRDLNGFDLLIDGGMRSAGARVVAYLHEQGVGDIDVMLASHPDPDHVGGLIEVLASGIPVEQILYSRGRQRRS